MPTIVIRLDAQKLHDPDLDLRYEIPDILAERSNGLLTDGGYDYESEDSAMHIYLATRDLDRALPLVVNLLESERLHGNGLAVASQIGVSDADVAVSTEFRIVYPPGAEGILRVPP